MKSASRLLLPLLFAATLWGCSDSDDNSDVGERTAAGISDQQSGLRAVHLSSDAPAVDIAVNNTKVLEGVSYRQASGFLAVDPGSTDIQVLAAGTDTAVIEATLDLTAGNRYSVLAINDLANIEPLVITDSSESPADGFAAVRVVHGAPTVPEVDVYVSGPADDFSGLSPLLENVPFRAVSDELEVPAGDYRVRLTLAGDSNVVYDSGAIPLADGVEYVAVASLVNEGLSPVGLTVLTNLESTPVALFDDVRARVRVVHASADAPEVDIAVNGATVLSEVPFGVASGYLTVPGDTYRVEVLASASGSSVISADLTFEPRTDTTVAAVNTLAELEALILSDDNSEPAEGFVKVRLVHAAVSAGNVDVYVTEPHADLHAAEPLIQEFEFKADSGYLEVPAGDYQVRITVAGTSTVAIDTGALTLESGLVYTAFALDPAHVGGDFGVLLLNDLE